jgi:predicted ester cyclase
MLRPMTTPHLVKDFYEQIWDAGRQSAVAEILSENFIFRGSLGAEMKGRDRFWDYVCSIRSALEQYHCDILECVAEGPLAFAKMRFGGIHVGDFRSHRPSGLPVHWHGAALFRFEDGRIGELWVLGDLAGLDATLSSNAGRNIDS